MDVEEFQRRLRELSHSELERFVLEIVKSQPRFSDAHRNSQKAGFEIDVIAFDFSGGTRTVWLFEVRKAKMIGRDVIENYAQKAVMMDESFDGPRQFVMVVAGGYSQSASLAAARHGIEVWDGLRLAYECPDEVAIGFFGDTIRTKPPKAPEPPVQVSAFEALLESIEPGQPRATQFQDAVSKILAYLFCPPLESPRYEDTDWDGRNRRDIIMENAAPSGYWAHLRSVYAAHYVVVDAKNHGGPIGKDDALRIAHYLKEYGCGLFGILVTRKGASKGCRHAIREQWVSARKLLVVLSDEDLVEMLRIKARNGAAEEIIRARIAEFRMKL